MRSENSARRRPCHILAGAAALFFFFPMPAMPPFKCFLYPVFTDSTFAIPASSGFLTIPLSVMIAVISS